MTAAGGNLLAPLLEPALGGHLDPDRAPFRSPVGPREPQVKRPAPRLEDLEDRPVALHEVSGGDPLRLARLPPVEGAPGGSSRRVMEDDQVLGERLLEVLRVRQAQAPVDRRPGPRGRLGRLPRFASRAARVRGPTIPPGISPRASWNRRAASSVTGPKTPSPSNPSSRRRGWSSTTSGPSTLFLSTAILKLLSVSPPSLPGSVSTPWLPR